MNRWIVVTVLVLAAWSGWQSWHHRAVEPGPGVTAPDEPTQGRLDAPVVFQVKDYRLEAQATYKVRARLLGREPYRFGREAELSPVDFALGWGPMSDTSLLKQMDISQSNRFFRLRWQRLSVPESTVMRHAANTHIIPASPVVADRLDEMRPGQVIELQGYLVNASAADGWRWRTSLTRKDTGAGACELFWVEQARIVAF
jgi:hypothetical protein